MSYTMWRGRAVRESDYGNKYHIGKESDYGEPDKAMIRREEFNSVVIRIRQGEFLSIGFETFTRRRIRLWNTVRSREESD